MLVIPYTFDSESSNLNFEVFGLTFANFTRLTAVKSFSLLNLPRGSPYDTKRPLRRERGQMKPESRFSWSLLGV